MKSVRDSWDNRCSSTLSKRTPKRTHLVVRCRYTLCFTTSLRSAQTGKAFCRCSNSCSLQLRPGALIRKHMDCIVATAQSTPKACIVQPQRGKCFTRCSNILLVDAHSYHPGNASTPSSKKGEAIFISINLVFLRKVYSALP